MGRYLFAVIFLLNLLGCESAHQETDQPPSNKDIPQHFSMNLEVSFVRSTEDTIEGQLLGVMSFDESLQQLAKQELETKKENRTQDEIDALSWTIKGSRTVALAGFTITAGGQTTTTDESGQFMLQIDTTIPFLDIMYYDVEKKMESVVLSLEIPTEVSTKKMVMPLEFDHRFPHDHPLHDHKTDHSLGVTEGALAGNQTTSSLACRKCNGWWDWDGGRAGSDCFLSLLLKKKSPCWGEAMNKLGTNFGVYCNGSQNCSKLIGHSWNDNHTHGSSKWTCTK